MDTVKQNPSIKLDSRHHQEEGITRILDDRNFYAGLYSYDGIEYDLTPQILMITYSSRKVVKVAKKHL
jgi:hypothetical protein